MTDEARIAAEKLALMITAQGAPLAFEATVGVLAPTLAAPSDGVLGPRTLAANELPMLSVGRTEADLVVTQPLGEGGMGIVELARQRSLQRDVAIKRPRMGAGGDVVSALLREAVYTGYLEHPNIVPVHALGRDEQSRPIMLMKKIDGVSLADLAHDAKNDAWARVGDRLAHFIDIMRRLCDALAFAHSRGVLHRDVKPENVMVGQFGEVYLLDWGVAMRIGDPLPPDAISGSLAYMAPEMLRPDAGQISERTDVYLVGATLHECLTGKPPHAKDDLPSVLVSIGESKPHAYGDSVPEEIAAVLHRAMALDPQQRYASAAELGQALVLAQSHRAAAELARTGTARLADLDLAIERNEVARVHTIFSEARFAFEQSLRGWAEGTAARVGLRNALVTMARFEIAQRNVASAEALIDSLDPKPDDLVARLDALRADIEADRSERDRLRRMDHELDDRVGADHRKKVMRFVATIVLLTAAIVLGLHFAGIRFVTPKRISVAMAPALVMASFVLYRWRAQFFANRINRQRGFTIMVALLLIGTNRIVGALLGRSLGDITSGDSLIAAAVAALSALTIRRVLFLPALFFLAAAIVAPMLAEDVTFMALLGAAILSVGVVIFAPQSLSAPALDLKK